MKKHLKLALLSVTALLGLTACNPSANTSSSSEESSFLPASSDSSTKESESSSNSNSVSQTTSSNRESSASSESKAPTISIVVPASKTLAIGQELQLSATYENAGENPAIVWHSSNENIISVDNTGKIKGLAAGESQITASIAGVNSEPITFIVETNSSYTKFLNLLTNADSLDATKVSNLTLSTNKDEYNYHENTDTKEMENTISMTSGVSYEASFYSDEKLRIDTLETQKNEKDKKIRHEYGIAHELLVDAVSDYSEENGYTFNDSKSNSSKASEGTNGFLNKGKFGESIGVVRYILDNYFGGTKNFSSEEARTNAALEEKDGAYTLSTNDIVKDNVENNVHMEYTMTVQFNVEGYLTALTGNVKSYDSDTDGKKRNLTTDTTVRLTQTVATRNAGSDIEFEKYFFTNKANLNLFLGENQYSSDPVADVKLNTKYYICLSKNGSASTNIDKIQFVSIKDGTSEASSDAYELDDMTVTFKKAGDYTLTFKTTLLNDFTIEAEIESHEITELNFAAKPAFASSPNSIDSTYLGSSVLAGDSHFVLDANEGAENDTTVEFISNEIGATITKDSGANSDFGYILHTERAGKVSFKFKSGSGVETPIKEVTVFPYTDEGIAAFLCDAKWNAINTSGILADLTFTLNSDSSTSGTFLTHTQSSAADVLGTFEVADNKVTVKVTKGSVRFTNLVVDAGSTGIYAGAYVAHLMLND